MGSVLWHQPFIFLFEAAGQFALPHPLPAAAPRCGELLRATVPAEQHRLALLVDLGVESGAIVNNDGFFDDEVLVLEIFPIAVKKLEPALHCAHVLQRHAELEIVHEEPYLVSSVNGVLLLIPFLLLLRFLLVCFLVFMVVFFGGLFDGQFLGSRVMLFGLGVRLLLLGDGLGFGL